MGPKQVTKRQAQVEEVGVRTRLLGHSQREIPLRQEERREAIHSLALLSVGGSVGDHLGNWKMSYCWALECSLY